MTDLPETIDRTVVAGIDIGGTTTQVVLCDQGLRLLARLDAPTPASLGGLAMMANAAGMLDTLLAETAGTLTAIGVGAPGVVDPAEGVVLVASDSFTNWTGFPITRFLAERFGVPTVLDNDANCFVRGEASAGAIAGESHAIGITLGTGVGGALWLGSTIYAGPHDAAGEIGHIPGFGDIACTCGGRGHLETIAAGRSVTRRYLERTGSSRTPLEIATLARGGDVDAIAVLRDLASALARALVIVANLLDVRTAVLGGGLAGSADLWRPWLLEALELDPPLDGRSLRILTSTLGHDAVAIGAAANAVTRG